MEERIWDLVEKFLSGEATERELLELQDLLLEHQEVYVSVKEFLETYEDPDPRVTEEEKEALFKEVERRGKLTAGFKKMTNRAGTTASEAIEIAGREEAEVKRLEGGAKPAEGKHKKPVAVFRNRKHSGIGQEMAMIGYFFKITGRSLLRNKSVSVIHIAGLAVGMTSAMLILLLIQYGFSFDRFHEKKERIYQVYNRAEFNWRLECWGNTSHVMAPPLKSDYPQVEDAVRVNWVGAFVFHAGGKHLETQGYITDPGFLSMFSFPLLEGNALTALNSPRSIVLTEKMARKLFGAGDAIGQTIRVDSVAYFTVTGVLEDLPYNSRFDFEYLIPWSYMKEVGWERQEWENNSIQTYVLLKPGVSEHAANDRIRDIVKLHAANVHSEAFLHPMPKWHLYSRFENGRVAGGFIETLRLLGVIAGFILLIACINYVNLSTARSEKRAREVGVRKVAGGLKSAIAAQFLAESVLIASFAGLLAVVIAQLCLPAFNDLTYSELSIPYRNGYFWAVFAGFVLFTGILAGSYPAVYLSSIKPINALKGRLRKGPALVTPRKALVVLQFSFAVVFIICTIVIERQIRYGQRRDAGYRMDHLAFTYIKGDMQKNYPLVKKALLDAGAVTSVTRTNSPVTYIWNNEDSYQWPGKDPDARFNFVQLYTDRDFTATMGLKLLAGRDINTEQYPGDSAAILLNESAAKLMEIGYPAGQIVKSRERSWHVVGIVEDFILGSPYQPIQPVVIEGAKSRFGTMTFRLNNKRSTAASLASIEKIARKYNPDYPFVYWFVEETYAEKFSGQRTTAKLTSLFSGLTIFISCLGLFGLATYMAEQRTKEIGIRKVLGASVAAIVALLSKDFVRLVLLAVLFAAPVAGYLMKRWLEGFAYRIEIQWWMFVLAGLMAVTIALLTVSFQSVKAALMNPVRSLRSE